MCKKDSKTESSHEESRAKNTATHDDPKGIFKFRNPESRISKLLDSKDLTAAKQWYQQNYDRNESRNCPVCQDLSADLANLLSRADTFKFATPVGALMAAFVASTTIQIMTSAVIATTALIALFVYCVAQRDSEERTKVAFKLMEFSRINGSDTSASNQKFCPQHQKLITSRKQ